ncbi:MAG: hypothetical protein MZV49_27330 [Rhodopseudomonas palustris]|nr:hypothetical protein [Rhodopseudomonas palustris]
MPTAADHDRTKYGSTGHLPPLEHVRRWLQGAAPNVPVQHGRRELKASLSGFRLRFARSVRQLRAGHQGGRP